MFDGNPRSSEMEFAVLLPDCDKTLCDHYLMQARRLQKEALFVRYE